jgi:hypothetical protein
MRVPIVLWLSVAAVALAAPANADSPHFYGVVWNTTVPNLDADDGALVNLNTGVLQNNGICDQFVDHEMWYGVVPGGEYFVEVGVISGETATPGVCVYQKVFWAEKVNGIGFTQHLTSVGWSLSTWYQAMIGLGGPCSWDVYFGGVYLGTSMYNCPGIGRFLAGGIEATSQSYGNDKGFMWSWERLDSTGTWQSGWDGATLSQYSPPYIRFTDGTQTESEETFYEPW